MKYLLSEKYNTPELQSKIMGPNPLKLLAEHKTNLGIVRGSLEAPMTPTPCRTLKNSAKASV